MNIKYSLPDFLVEVIPPDVYRKWLHRKASAHVRRDGKRNSVTISVSSYKEQIHKAVIDSRGLDVYTGEQLDWSRIGTYKNEDSKVGKHGYKKEFALLPTIDHITAGTVDGGFHICSWRTNDSKSDLSIEEFVDLCQKVVDHSSRKGKQAA